MFFLLEDDGCVHVYASAGEVASEIEALDAEGCIRAAFDAEARPHRIEWLRPDRVGLDGSYRLNGGYRLVPAGPPDREAFLALFTRARPVSADDRPAVEALVERLSAETPTAATAEVGPPIRFEVRRGDDELVIADRRASSWSRTTLRISSLECWIEHRRLFGTKRLHGALRDLDLVGVAELSPRKPRLALHLALGGTRLMAFRGAGRQDLEWLLSEVRDWRRSHGAS
jgi:hypothetical protein